MPRRCGDCNACCKVLKIEELNLPDFTVCPHLKSGYKGCTIHSSRPSACREFECVWKRTSIGSNRHRPDRSGVMFMLQNNDQRGNARVTCYNTRKSQSWSLEAQELIQILKDHNFRVFEVSPDQKRPKFSKL